ncbi:hypothetical protein F0562_026609 [Nyssa sinensis]|uniref:Glycosyl transferase CAP10 domain-containing protein n=1 Tax=Nyssa sinensis TaxID=561372 RepID=A0A5J5BDY4_9ASTE|nr:hypothetical protein F0562_026609 [Nyssa sinensis]
MQRFQRYSSYGSEIYRHFTETFWRPLFIMKDPPGRSSLVLFFFFLLLFLGAFVSTHLLDNTVPSITQNSQQETSQTNKIEIPLNCSAGNLTRTCPANYYPKELHRQDLGRSSASPAPTCPDYFRWIHEDLRPWRETGITKDMVERANRTANFRLVIVKGKAYVEQYQKAFQTRDVFTLWGILQLLRRYPGKLPDLELMFDCVDWPVIISSDYSGPNATAPPPLFRYCGNNATLDIVFPDWSFWGWAETNIKPWEGLLRELKEGNKTIRTGMPVYMPRIGLKRHNKGSSNQTWLANVFIGSAWSVSEKYILACDSVTLMVKPHYYDFFTRGLMPLHHYWPIRDDDKCKSIKFAVDWGNSHKRKAQTIGKAASNFIQEDLNMDFVYDYMFHLLNEYAKLFQYKPTVPQEAIELCSETMACPVEGLEKKFMMESLVKGPADSSPCTMPPSYDPHFLYSFLRIKENSIQQVELREKKYWENQTVHI